MFLCYIAECFQFFWPVFFSICIFFCLNSNIFFCLSACIFVLVLICQLYRKNFPYFNRNLYEWVVCNQVINFRGSGSWKAIGSAFSFLQIDQFLDPKSLNFWGRTWIRIFFSYTDQIFIWPDPPFDCFWLPLKSYRSLYGIPWIHFVIFLSDILMGSHCSTGWPRSYRKSVL